MTYICELCGFTYHYDRGQRPRFCPDDRAEGHRRAKQAHPATPELTHALAATLVTQRLAIEAAIHALTLAALARHLDWDDRAWMQAALDTLTSVRPVSEVFSA